LSVNFVFSISPEVHRPVADEDKAHMSTVQEESVSSCVKRWVGLRQWDCWERQRGKCIRAHAATGVRHHCICTWYV